MAGIAPDKTILGMLYSLSGITLTGGSISVGGTRRIFMILQSASYLRVTCPGNILVYKYSIGSIPIGFYAHYGRVMEKQCGLVAYYQKHKGDYAHYE
jgi:hypothetical protein